MRVLRHTLALGAALGLVTLGGLSSRAGAQARPGSEARGWVGISLQVPVVPLPEGQRVKALVTDVSAGSPAARAGVKAGDLILSINGHGAEDGFGGITQTLRAGQRVTVVVERNGRRRAVRMVADPRPDTMAEAPRWTEWTASLGSDSMADLMFQAMDSLRLRLLQGGNGLMGVITLPGMDDVPVSGNMPAPGRILLRDSGNAPAGVFAPRGSGSVTFQLLPEVRPPFSFFVFPGNPPDSLQSEMDQLNARIRALRVRQAQRLRELAAQAPREGNDVGAHDPELQSLARALDTAGRQAAELQAAMRRAAAAQSGGVNGAAANAAGTQSAEEVSLRPLAPYLLGQDRVAGAEVVKLRPELARYFRVDGGVLVVDVPAGTPAALAGIRPGDVVTSVNGVPIRSIEELRLGLAKAGSGPLVFTLVRKGRTLKARLPR